MDVLSKNIIHLVIKLGEAGCYLSLMHQNIEVMHQEEAQVVSNTKAEIASWRRISRPKLRT